MTITYDNNQKILQQIIYLESGCAIASVDGDPNGQVTGVSGIVFRKDNGTIYVKQTAAYDSSNWSLLSGGSISGSGTANQLTYWNGTSSITSSPNFSISSASSDATLRLGNNSAAVANRAHLFLYGYGGSGLGQAEIGFQSGRGTAIAPTATQSNDSLGYIWFYGHTGLTTTDGAQIRATATATWTSSSAPAELTISVTQPSALAVARSIGIQRSSNNPLIYFYGSGVNQAAIRYNDSINKLQFAHDASTFSDIGSGSITALTGDVTASGTGSVAATIANQAVTYAKIQNVTDARLLGRSAGSSGSVQEITIGSNLVLSGGVLSASGGGSPGGSNKQIQFNSSGAFGGATGFEYQSGASPNVLIAQQAAALIGLQINGFASNTAPLSRFIQGSSGTGLFLDCQNSSATSLFTIASTGQVFSKSNYVTELGGYFGSNSGVSAATITLQGSGSPSIAIASTYQYVWGSSTNVLSGSGDTGLARTAAKTVRITDGSTGSGNLIIAPSTASIGASGTGVLAIGNGTIPVSSPADEVQIYAADSAAGNSNLFALPESNWPTRLSDLCFQVSSDFVKTSSTTLALITGLSVNVETNNIYRFRAVLFTTSSSSGGIKFSVAGTCTASNIIYEAKVIDNNAFVVPGASRAIALSTTVGNITAVTAALVLIEGSINVSAGGTLQVQFAQNVSNAASSRVLTGSYFEIFSARQ